MKITNHGSYWLAEYRIPGRSAVLMTTGDTIAETMKTMMQTLEKWNDHQAAQES